MPIEIILLQFQRGRVPIAVEPRFASATTRGAAASATIRSQSSARGMDRIVGLNAHGGEQRPDSGRRDLNALPLEATL